MRLQDQMSTSCGAQQSASVLSLGLGPSFFALAVCISIQCCCGDEGASLLAPSCSALVLLGTWHILVSYFASLLILFQHLFFINDACLNETLSCSYQWINRVMLKTGTNRSCLLGHLSSLYGETI